MYPIFWPIYIYILLLFCFPHIAPFFFFYIWAPAPEELTARPWTYCSFSYLFFVLSKVKKNSRELITSSIIFKFCLMMPVSVLFSLVYYNDVWMWRTIMKACIMCFEQLYLMIALTTKQYLVCGWSKVMFLWYFIINEFFEPMLLQMQRFFKDMNAICKVLNIG